MSQTSQREVVGQNENWSCAGSLLEQNDNFEYDFPLEHAEMDQNEPTRTFQHSRGRNFGRGRGRGRSAGQRFVENPAYSRKLRIVHKYRKMRSQEQTVLESKEKNTVGNKESEEPAGDIVIDGNPSEEAEKVRDDSLLIHPERRAVLGSRGRGRAHPFLRAAAEAGRLKLERVERRQKIEEEIRNRELSLQESRKRRNRVSKKLNARTSRGQPIMAAHISHIVEKLQREQSSE